MTEKVIVFTTLGVIGVSFGIIWSFIALKKERGKDFLMLGTLFIPASLIQSFFILQSGIGALRIFPVILMGTGIPSVLTACLVTFIYRRRLKKWNEPGEVVNASAAARKSENHLHD